MAATDKYRVDSDAVARFIKERCYVNGNAKVTHTELYGAWETWARIDGAEALAPKAFGQALERHGLPPSRTSNRIRWRHGLMLRPDETDSDSDGGRYR